MKILIITLSTIACLVYTKIEQNPTTNSTTEVVIGSSFSLVNDTKEKVSIHTGRGFVSLNKGSKTSITCNVGKTVSWANKGKKGDAIFKITSDMCGKTIKLSKVMD